MVSLQKKTQTFLKTMSKALIGTTKQERQRMVTREEESERRELGDLKENVDNRSSYSPCLDVLLSETIPAIGSE